MHFRKVIAATGVVGALLFASACSASETPTAPAGSPSVSASTAAAEPTAAPTANTVALKMPAGIIAKGMANDGKGDYLQTSISDDDPAMKYNPAIADDAAKEHYSDAELAEAQKVIVKFIAEEAIDSTLNGGNPEIDGWFAAHKDQILPANQPLMLKDMKSTEVKNGDVKAGVISTEKWMLDKPNYSYIHGDNTPRVTARTITPVAFRFVENPEMNLQGVMLDTTVSYSMAVMNGSMKSSQNSTGELSFAVAKDEADGGKWKIAGYNTNYHTREG